MKRCPVCDRSWQTDKVFCPWDGYKLKEMSQEEIEERSKTHPVEPEFEVFTELANSNKTLQDSLIEFGSTETSKLVDVAISALEKRRERDQELLRDQMRLFEKFNLHCRTMQYFVDRLKEQSEMFSFQVMHRDEVDQMYMMFIVSFGQGDYKRNFPAKVTYLREPTKEVNFEINLYEIADNKDKRHSRTEKIGGQVEVSPFGRKYYKAPPRDMEGVELLQWLDNSFKDIFRMAYTVD